MTRLKVFIDYQNAYHCAQDMFDLDEYDPVAPHIRPLRLGVLLKQLGEEHDPNRELIEVRIYRGEPTNKSHAKLQGSFQRQVAAWREREPMLKVITRPLRYNPTTWDYTGKATAWDTGREKGIDVLIALDLVLGAINNEYDIAVLMSGDSDLEPAIDEVLRAGKYVENAVWRKTGEYARRLQTSLPGRNIWCHYLDEKRFALVQDPTDYLFERGDTGAL